MATSPLAALKGNPRNPRKITAAKRAQLARTLDRFGDLGGIVFNRRSGQLVGGHQRVDVFRQDKKARVTITERIDPPNAHGTAEEGYVEAMGHRFSYRVVDWDAPTEMAANLAANKGAGDFDMPEVANWMHELDAASFDLDLTLFDADERQKLVDAPTFSPVDAEPVRLDKMVRKSCPECGHEF